MFELDHKVPPIRGGSNQLVNLRVLCLPCHDGKSTSNLTDAEWRAKGRPRIGAESAGFLTVAAGAIGSPAWTGTVRGTRCVHRLPSHISKMVPSTIHIGPLDWTKSKTFVLRFKLAHGARRTGSPLRT